MKGFIENTEETHTEREGDRQTGRQADGERERERGGGGRERGGERERDKQRKREILLLLSGLRPITSGVNIQAVGILMDPAADLSFRVFKAL